MSEHQFQEIVKQLQQGNNRSLKVVFETYGDYCVRRLRRHVHCRPEDAEDIFQDAVLVFRENALQNKIRYTTNLKSYLYSICFNLHRSYRQRQKQQKDYRYTIAEHLHELSEIPQAEKDIVQQEQQEAIRLTFTAFNRLGENCRKLLTYFYIDELDNATIARNMNLANTNVVKSSKFRCMRHWVKHLRELQDNQANVEKRKLEK